MNKKTTTVLHSVVRELFEDGMELDPSRFEGLNPPIDPGAYDQNQLQMPGATWDPQYQDAGTPGLPSMSPVYSDPQGLAMSPDHRVPDYPDQNRYLSVSPDHREPQYTTPEDIAQSRNAMYAGIAAHNPTARGYDPALGNIQFYPEGMPPISPDHRVPNYFDHNINTLANDVRQLGQGVAHNNAATFNNSINSVADTARQVGGNVTFGNSINNVANTARQAGQDIAFNNSINSVADTARQAGSQIALNNATNTVRDNIDRVANRFQRDAMQNQIEAHNRTQPNGVDPAVGVHANIRAHNPKTGYDPALGPVINAANGIKDSVSNLASPQPWYQNGLNWMKNNKIATAGMIGVPAALAGAYMLNKRRNRNQQNG